MADSLVPLLYHALTGTLPVIRPGLLDGLSVSSKPGLSGEVDYLPLPWTPPQLGGSALQLSENQYPDRYVDLGPAVSTPENGLARKFTTGSLSVLPAGELTAWEGVVVGSVRLHKQVTAIYQDPTSSLPGPPHPRSFSFSGPTH